MDVAHLVDLNKNEQPFNLPYSNRIKLCDETERRLLYLIGKCKEHRIRVNKPEDVESFTENIGVVGREKKKAIHLLFDAIENDVAEKEKFVAQITKTISELKHDVGKLQDYLQVLKFVQVMIPSLGAAMPARHAANDHEAPLIESVGGNVSFVSGTIKDGEQDRLKRLLFRVTRGKALTHFHEFTTPDDERKAVYLVVYANLRTMREQVQKICDSFMGQRFEIPEFSQLEDSASENQIEIQKAQGLLATSEQ